MSRWTGVPAADPLSLLDAARPEAIAKRHVEQVVVMCHSISQGLNVAELLPNLLLRFR